MTCRPDREYEQLHEHPPRARRSRDWPLVAAITAGALASLPAAGCVPETRGLDKGTFGQAPPADVAPDDVA